MRSPTNVSQKGHHQNDHSAALAEPMVSVCMLAYNVELYIGAAIEGVLQQQVDFQYELVIGKDASTDRTREICERYQRQYPKIIRVLTATQNLGIAGNAARTLPQCKGKYIAICDGDDVWTDPHKLSAQVKFLETHPDYGLSYSDVHTITDKGKPFIDPEQEDEPEHHAQGNIFIQLLHGNFITNSTAVFRRQLLDGFVIDTDRNYYIHDFFMWLHISLRSKVHFLPLATTAYRRHPGGVTNSIEKTRLNSHKFHQELFHLLHDFSQINTKPLSHFEKIVIFRKALSLLYRKGGSLKMKLRITPLLLKYFPGFSGLWTIFSTTPHALLPQLYEEHLYQL